MDTRLFEHIQNQCPEFNRDVTRGLAVIALNGSADGVNTHVEDYIHRALRCAEADFPEGLKYIGRGTRCTPHEEFAVLTAKRGQSTTAKVNLELSHSDVYLMRYNFEYRGEELKPVYLWLPFCHDGGIIGIGGSTFSISPVLADKSISVGEDSIYIPVSRAKLTLKRQTHPFYADRERISANVIWGKIHNGATKKIKGVPTRRTITADATLPHYLFCKYGFHNAFTMLTGIQVHAGYDDHINPENFPEDEYVICKSLYKVLGAKPNRLRTQYYEPSRIQIAIPRNKFNHAIQSLIGGFYYVADRFPDRLTPNTIDDIRVWRILMGHIIFATDDSEGKLLNQIDAHMESLDTYVDTNVRDLLQEDNVFVDDLYELFCHINETFVTRVAESASQIASMYDKRLTVLRYILGDVTNAIFYVVFALRKAAKKELNKRVIQDIMRIFLKMDLILKLNHKHVEVSSISSPSDCMAFKITSNIILQSDIGSGNAQSKSITIDGSKVLHSSILEVGQFANLPKTEPTGRRRVNPYVLLDSSWTVMRHPDYIGFLETVQQSISK